MNALYMEISAVGICLLLMILFNQYRTIGSSTLQRQFNRLIYSAIAMLVVDAACWVIDGTTFPNARKWNIAIETLYYLLNVLIPYMWAVYVEIAIGKDQKINRWRLRILALPLLFMAVMLLLNLHTPFMFTISEANIYSRGAGFVVFAAIAFAYLVYAALRALFAMRRAAWKEEKRRYSPMLLVMLLPAIGGVIQVFSFGVTLIWIFAAVAIMMLYIDSLNRQISTDPLTGINNRRELTKYLVHETKEPAYDGVLALLMMDVDGFKQINDDHGHYYGDGVLIAVAEILKQACKNTPAFLARYGGDEFCIVYPAESVKAVEKIIAGIQARVETWNEQNDALPGFGLSVGFSIWQPDIADTVEALYRRADMAMYRIKAKKKDKE